VRGQTEERRSHGREGKGWAELGWAVVTPRRTGAGIRPQQPSYMQHTRAVAVQQVGRKDWPGEHCQYRVRLRVGLGLALE